MKQNLQSMNYPGSFALKVWGWCSGPEAGRRDQPSWGPWALGTEVRGRSASYLGSVSEKHESALFARFPACFLSWWPTCSLNLSPAHTGDVQGPSGFRRQQLQNERAGALKSVNCPRVKDKLHGNQKVTLMMIPTVVIFFQLFSDRITHYRHSVCIGLIRLVSWP